jgi:hypothetical protein
MFDCPPAKPPAANRTWVREFFKDHPKLAQKSPEAFSGTGGTRDKPKVFCNLCLEHRINQQHHEDEQQVINGTRQDVRSREMIVLECVISRLRSV